MGLGKSAPQGKDRLSPGAALDGRAATPQGIAGEGQGGGMRKGIALALAFGLATACAPRAAPPAAAAPPVLCNGATVACMNEVLALGIK